MAGRSVKRPPKTRVAASAPARAANAGLDRHALALAVLAVLVRIPHLAWGLPDLDEEALPMKKALEMWGWTRGAIDLDPRTAGWPSLSFYVHLALQHLHYWVGRLTGAFADRNDYFVAAWLDRGTLLLLSRGLSVATAAGVVWVTARIARRLAGVEAAWLAAGLLVASPLLIEYSQLVTPDILATLFAALAVDRILAIHARGTLRDYLWAGAWIGLGISSKYTPLLLFPGLVVAHALRPPGARVSLRPWLALAAATLAFALASPYVAFQPAILLRDVARQSLHMTAGHFGQGALPSGVFYLVEVLGPGLGWGGLAVALAGLAWAAARRRGAWLVLAGCVLPYYLGLGLLKTQFPRYVLPLLMPIALGVAGLVAMLRARRAGGEAAHLSPGWSVALAAVVLLPAIGGAWRYHAEKGRPDARQLANRFVVEIAARGSSHILAENLSLTLPTSRATGTLDPALLQRLTPSQRSRLLGRRTYDVDFLPMYTVQPERAAFYYDLRHFADYDLIVVSDAVRNRYLADTVRFAPAVRFYRDLERYTALERRFDREQRATGPAIRIYRTTVAGSAALRRERGELDLGAAVAAGAPFHPPDYLAFVEGVARAAAGKQDWVAAERYYGLLLQAGERGALAPDQVAALRDYLQQLRARAAASGAAP